MISEKAAKEEILKMPKEEIIKNINNFSINVRDDIGRKYHLTVNCVVCQKEYYPGCADDKDRPRNKSGKLIRVSMAEKKGFCSMVCQRKYK